MIELALANAVLVITITKSSLFKPLRNNIKNNFLKKLFHCPYCLSHWTSLILIAFSINYTLSFSFFNFIIETLALIAITSIFAYLLLLYLKLSDKTQ